MKGSATLVGSRSGVAPAVLSDWPLLVGSELVEQGASLVGTRTIALAQEQV